MRAEFAKLQFLGAVARLREVHKHVDVVRQLEVFESEMEGDDEEARLCNVSMCVTSQV